ncbi:hypothetical protein RYZ27_05085 [Hyphomonas sp. FCG-A18]|uniref:hypothetical protein n=1 Tax=Hyphomonas sp. FCG-A18 TaxID=3080019 RepID=UPI002B307F98|nr:hypothetical protein RYZ27_05085 [Hyphomonas sp. FCG-A18]
MTELEERNRDISLWTWLGAIVGAISLFGFAQEVWQFGLAPVLVDLVTYYRKMMEFLFGWLWLLLPFEVWDWYKNVLGCGIVLCGIFARSNDFSINPDLPETTSLSRIIVMLVIFSLCFPLLGLTLLIFVYAVLATASSLMRVVFKSGKLGNASGRAFNRRFASILLKTAFILVGFFIWNAYGLSIG